jgi:hypothetical protein
MHYHNERPARKYLPDIPGSELPVGARQSGLWLKSIPSA